MTKSRGLKISKQKVVLISDIHGSYSELTYMLANIKKDALIIFMGDFIDRGLHSKEVLDLIYSLVSEGKALAIQGNHELDFLNFMSFPETYLFSYLKPSKGGYNTLKSLVGYDFDKNCIDSLYDVVDNIPDKYLDFIESLPTYIEMGDYLFTHAGINPNYKNIADNSKEDLTSIRDKFYNNKLKTKHKVFFGHTPVSKISGGNLNVIWFNEDGNKFGIDGGCGTGNLLIGVKINPLKNKLSVFSVNMSNKKSNFFQHHYKIII